MRERQAQGRQASDMARRRQCRRRESGRSRCSRGHAAAYQDVAAYFIAAMPVPFARRVFDDAEKSCQRQRVNSC